MVVTLQLTKRCAIALCLIVGLLGPLSSAGADEVFRLTPSAQPDEDALAPGLGVTYAYADIRWLREVEGWIESSGRPGTPLENLGYYSEANEPALTSKQNQFVLAHIDGFIKFPAAGRYELEFASNDGLSVTMAGVEVYRHDGRHVCDTLGSVFIDIETPGWYPLHIVYFQRNLSSCLWLSWRKPGDAGLGEDAVPGEYFAHVAN